MFAYVGSIQNLKDLTDIGLTRTSLRRERRFRMEVLKLFRAWGLEFYHSPQT